MSRSSAAMLLVVMTVMSGACASTPRNPVLDNYPAGVSGRTTVDYYDVRGGSPAELRADMRRRGPKIAGSSYIGETRSPMRWSWSTESVAPGSCLIKDVRVSVNAQILLPRWTPSADADSALVAEWKRFISALEVHESGHKDISARAGREIIEQLRGMTGLCSQISTRASDVARQFNDRARDAQVRYDAETRHGLTQGTAFAAPRAPSTTNGSGSAPGITRIMNDSLRRSFEVSRAHADSAA